jgi:hypothetical protein
MHFARLELVGLHRLGLGVVPTPVDPEAPIDGVDPLHLSISILNNLRESYDRPQHTVQTGEIDALPGHDGYALSQRTVRARSRQTTRSSGLLLDSLEEKEGVLRSMGGP